MSPRLPVTPLPWKVSSDAKLRILGATPTGRPQLAGTGQCVNDALYIVHAANAYPKLVERVRGTANDLKRWREQSSGKVNEFMRMQVQTYEDELRALLSKLGEAP